MNTAEGKSVFFNLPVEMKMSIFQHLDLNSKRSTRLVCHSWNSLIDDSLILKPELNDETCNTITNSPLKTTHLTVTKLQNSISGSRTRNGWLENVKKITFKEDSVGVSEENVKKILRPSCEYLRLLQFDALVLKNITSYTTIWARMSFRNILHLRIILYTFDLNHNRAIEELLAVTTFPSLYELKISFTDIRVPVYFHPAKSYAKMLTTVYTFIAKHASTLKNLWFYEAEEMTKPKIATPIRIKLSNEVITSLSQLNLTRLRLFLGNFDDNHPIWPAICLAKNHTNLSTLDLWGAPVPADFRETIQNNISTLRYLYWTSDHVDQDGNNGFDLSLLAGATNLLHLDISSNEIYNFEYLPRQIQRLVWSSDLTIDQLGWICKNMKLVTYLLLEQNSDNETDVPYINILLLKQILKMDSLEMLKVYGRYDDKALPEFCNGTPGLTFQMKPDSEEENEISRVKARKGFKILIDRPKLHPIYLM